MKSWIRDFSMGLRIMDGHGLTEGFGHLSIRKPNGNIVITPALGPGMAASESLCILLDDTGKRLDETDLPAPLETPLHLGIYAARSDVTSICRTHPRYLVSYGATGESLNMSHGFSRMLGLEAPCFPNGDLIHSQESGESAAQSLGTSSALILKGNGGLTVGESISQAVVRAIYLEEAARIALDVRAAGMELSDWKKEEVENREKWHAAEASRAWDYYCWRYSQ